ncbi:MAG: amino acid ABC transporter substrate-binding protein [Proteobacteria bacterium]|nr:amino acid ABC transporter substrate-binding protein [Pseudomonadota bacterium]
MKFTKAIVAAAALSFIGVTAQAQTLEAVKSRGHVLCGVSQGLPGFSNPDDKGNWTGIDVDVCRAVGVAIFGKGGKVKFVPLSAKERFTALQSGEIDVLSRNTTWTFSRDNSLGLEFVGVNYYDGQGFMVRKDLGVKSAKELDGAAVCTNTGTTTELNVADYFRGNKMEYKVVAFEKADEVVAAYDSGRCDVYTTDRSGLAAQRTKLKNPDDHMVLPEIISKEPLGPAVRHGDSQWGDIVRWSLNTMIIAEELGVHSGNVDEMKTSSNPEIKRMLGMEANFGEQIGLGQDFAYNIIKNVGNYAQSYNAHVGPNTPLKLDRGLNALWNNGGILYAPPFR